MRHWPHLDGLRGLAALLVLITHVSFWTGENSRSWVGALGSRGEVGVAVFFALSAFLLSGPYLADRSRGALPYAVRRAARILPAYWVALAVVLMLTGGGVVAVSGLQGENPQVGLGGATKVLTHLVLMQGFSSQWYQAFSQTWSLTTEVVFYGLLPFLAVGLRRLRPADQGVVVAALFVLGLVVQAISVQGWVTWLGLSPIGHAAWFAVGLGARLLSRAGRLALVRPTVAVVVAGLAYLAVATPLGGPRMFGAATAVEAIVKEALYAVVAGSLLLAAAHGGGRLAGLLASRPMVWLGRVSYGVFLWHLVVLQVLFVAGDLALFHTGFWALLPLVLAGSLALGWLSWVAVERPALAMSALWLRRRAAGADTAPTVEAAGERHPEPRPETAATAQADPDPARSRAERRRARQRRHWPSA